MSKTDMLKDTTDAAKLRSKRSLCLTSFIVSVFFLIMLPKEHAMETLRRLEMMGLSRGLQQLWYRDKASLIGLAVFAVLALVCLISFLRYKALGRRLAHEPENIPENGRTQPRPAAREIPAAEKKPEPKTKKPADKKSLLIVWIVIAFIMICFSALDPETLLPAFTTVIIVTAIMLVVLAAAKKRDGGNTEKKHTQGYPEPKSKGNRAASSLFRHKDEQEAEEAVHCAHLRGKEKYIEQLDGYLRAGLIDTAEYKVLKERYSKLDIPDDYH